MLDELDRLQENVRLLELLSYYADLGAENREAWQSRLMQMESLNSAELSGLHGELIAFGWVEQNTGQVPSCYRVTPSGLRAVRWSRAQENEEDDLQEAA